MDKTSQDFTETLGVLISEFKEVKKYLLEYTSNTYKVYSTEEVLQILGVSKKTLSDYRNKGKIAFSQEGLKIFYTQDDIDDFLKAGYKPRFKTKLNN